MLSVIYAEFLLQALYAECRGAIYQPEAVERKKKAVSIDVF